MRKPASEDVKWQVTALGSAQRTLGRDPATWHGFNGGWDVLAASLATEGEVADAGRRDEEHEKIIRRIKDEDIKTQYGLDIYQHMC